MRSSALCLAVLLFGPTSPAHADLLRLKEGRQIRGEVLKESDDTIYVDLGYTVLAVPKSAVVAREKAPPDEDSRKARVKTSQSDLFSTVERAEATVKRNVARTEASVVMIRTPTALGSGFVITPDGYVITNDHVVQGETHITVVLFERDAQGTLVKRFVENVRIVATNPHIDLALLKMDGVKDLPIAYVGDSDDVKVGQTVYAIGNPHGLERTVSEGIVSTLHRVMDGRTHLQTTAAVNPGNSGGPLFNLEGEVIGVVDLKLTFSEGLNFAIPVDRVRRFLREREAFAYDKDHPNSGYRYLPPPKKAAPQTGTDG